MDFIPNQEAQNRAMLQALGIDSVEELFTAIPKRLKQDPPKSDDGLSELEGMQLMEALAKENQLLTSYLGAGAYEHHVPAIVSAICSKSEFLTSYTPYQAEASQGMLQATFEFQSAICALTGLDVANASLYDGASACAEAILMAMRLNPEQRKLMVSPGLHPSYRAVVNQYVAAHDVEFVDALDEQTAALLVQSPNFFGTLEDVAPLFAQAKKLGVICILCANPLAYGLFASAGELGADIAVGDGQPFGLPLQFGGPYVGYMACRQEWVRQLPGRIVGETVDSEGRRGYVLTLQAREQHIRREKATSNICTNQALAALACLVAILWYGKEGMRKLALTNYRRAAYLKNELREYAVDHEPSFNEFRLDFKKDPAIVQHHFRANGIEPGVDLSCFYSNLCGQFLVAVTETKNKQQLDAYIACARGLR